MKAIILAAGRGSRMGSLTSRHPKCWTELGGHTLFQWQVAAFRSIGINEIGVVTGYLAEVFESQPVETFNNPRWSETNMVVSMMAAKKWLSTETCILSYSDIVYHPSILEKLVSSRGDLVITYDRSWKGLWELRFDDPLDDAETFVLDDQGKLADIGRKTDDMRDIQGQYMGLLRTNPQSFAEIEKTVMNLSPKERDKLDMTSLLQKLLHTGYPIDTAPTEGKWLEVDSETDLRAYQKRIESGNWEHDWRWE